MTHNMSKIFNKNQIMESAAIKYPSESGIGENFLCFFCCKSVNVSDESNGDKYDNSKTSGEKNTPGGKRKVVLERFFNLVSRQLNFCWKSSCKGEDNLLHGCFHCFEIIKQFCALYHQLKCLELQLNWQVEKLWNVMRFADRVPSRAQAFRKWCDNNIHEELEEIGNERRKEKAADCNQLIKLRKRFQRQCKSYRSKTLPRVRIPVHSTNGETTLLSGDAQKNTLRNNDRIDTATVSKEFIDSSNTERNSRKKQKNEYYFFGWTMSFAAVIFLYNLTAIRSRDGNRKNADKSIEDTQSSPAQFPAVLNVQDDDHETHEGGISDSAGSIISESSNNISDTTDDDDNYSETDDFWNNAEEVEDKKFDPSSLSIVDTRNENTAAVHFFGDDRIVEVVQQPFTTASTTNPAHFFETCSSPETATQVRIAKGPESELKINVTDLDLVTTPSAISQAHPITASLLLPAMEEFNPSNDDISMNKLYQPPPSLNVGAIPGSTAPTNRRTLRQKFQCTICKATFASSERLKLHEGEAHINYNNLEACGSEDDDEECDKMDKDAKFGKRRKIDPEWKSAELKSEPESEIDNDDDNEMDIFSEAESEEEHEKSNSPSTHKCYKCNPNVEFIAEYRLGHHMKYFHSNGNSRIAPRRTLKIKITQLKLEGFPQQPSEHQCPAKDCLKVFASPQELQKHSEVFHGTGNGKNSMSCHFCELQLTSPIDLIDHELEHSNDKQRLDNAGFQPGKRSFFCGRCNVAISKKSGFINHYLEMHLKISSFQATCPICRQTFPTEQVPMHHYVNCHDLNRLDDSTSPFRCEKAECNAYFLTENQLHVHHSTQHPHLTTLNDGNNKKYVKKTKQKLRKKKQCKINMEAKNLALASPRKHRKPPVRNIGGFVISTPEENLTVNDLATDQKAKFFCSEEHCKKGFMEEQDIEIHSKLHGRFKCNFCEVVQTSALKLAMHEQAAHKQVTEQKNVKLRAFSCTRCSFSTNIQYNYLEHFVEKHLGLMLDKIRCPICKYVYKYVHGESSLQNFKKYIFTHYKDCHDMKNSTNSQVHRCEQCSAYFLTSLQLQRHILVIHDKISIRDRHKCADCGIVFCHATALRSHRKDIHKVSDAHFQFVCSVPNCEKRFETRLQLENHKSLLHLNTKSQFLCPKKNCGRKFWSICALKGHLRGREHNKSGHVCDECAKVFATRSRLKRHKMFHAGPETWKFSCTICNKKSSTRQNHNVHMRTHTLEKPFVCQVCGAAFSHGHNLRKHVNKHT